MEQAIKNKREMDIEIERSLGGSDGDSRLLSAFLGGERGYFLMGLSELAKEKLNVPSSLFGKGKGKISEFKTEDRLKLHEL